MMMELGDIERLLTFVDVDSNSVRVSLSRGSSWTLVLNELVSNLSKDSIVGALEELRYLLTFLDNWNESEIKV
ncbi:hypothetical protein WICPIJ_005655 [Wickerhamomyces pijperi]|uniref:Uncharacterized protein n=1 Tax=Wickerhamomyces pijperi TaxID=599730 RepID=A0A9P8Q357_WICPI|nr:hypothetical protein WICPIJ_005655 [Wickerhamomyces pijperi]